MIYAQLEHFSTGWNGSNFSGPVTSIPMCGSDGVVILDARFSRQNMIATVQEQIKKRLHPEHITGFRLLQGRSFSDSRPITGFIAKRHCNECRQDRDTIVGHNRNICQSCNAGDWLHEGWSEEEANKHWHKKKAEQTSAK